MLMSPFNRGKCGPWRHQLMKRWTLLVLGMIALTGLTGCMENAMLLKLDTDGSGTLTYRVFMSEDMLNMA